MTRINGFKTWAAVWLLLLLAGCNLYNPAGTGDAGSDPLAGGEEQYRRGRFAEAMASFEAAIRADSNNSLAYYGYAKATARYFRLDNLGILNDLNASQGGRDFVFIEGHSDSVLTARMQAAFRVSRVLYLLTDRDTLSRWYNYLRDSTRAAARADTLRDARIAWMQDYLAKADAGVPGYRNRNRFPLTDFRMTYDKVIVDFTAFQMMYVLTSKLRDLDQNDTIDSRDDLLKRLSFGKGEGGFAIDSLSKIAGNLETDPQAAENLNALIQGMESGMSDISQLARLISFSSSSDDTGSGAGKQASNNIDGMLSGVGESIAFYQFGDRLDNDGDGCVDEEVLDDKDNDGDGFVDEDARITTLTLFEDADNDRNGKVNDSGLVNGNARIGLEDMVGWAHTTPVQPFPYILAFVHNFYAAHPDSTGKFVKIHKGSADMPLRARIQRDSLGLSSRRLLPGYAQKLDSAKALVGGCWRNYTPPSLGRRSAR